MGVRHSTLMYAAWALVPLYIRHQLIGNCLNVLEVTQELSHALQTVTCFLRRWLLLDS